MRDLLKTIKLLKKNKSAEAEGTESGGVGFIVIIIITLIVGGVIFWLVVRSLGGFI